jgi:DNA-binding NarL/FixJ family response regulator
VLAACGRYLYVQPGVTVDPKPLSSAAVHSVAIVTDDELLARRIRDSLAGSAVDVLESAASVTDLSEAAAAASAIVLTGRAGAGRQRTALRAVEERFPGVPRVVIDTLSTSGIHKALDAGASGLVLEAQIEAALAATIRAVCAGQVVIPHQFQSSAVRPALSHREKQTLALVVMGLTNREIATRLYLAESTVKTHLTSVFGKLGVRSRSEAAALVLDPDVKLGASVLGSIGKAPEPQA